MNLEMCNECLNYKILNEDGRCQECKLKNKTTEKFFKITVDCRDFDCVKKAIEVINDYVCENGMDDYSDKILKALLGEDYQKEYLIGVRKSL